MRKAFIMAIIVILGIGGYLGWDWHDKTKKQQKEPSITLYYWTDSKGDRHISDSPPPENIKNVTTDKGYKHIRTPLVVTIKNKAINLYQKITNTLFKRRKARKS
jgi:hypothetical protein